MEHEKQREKLIELIVNAKRADPETGSFTEFLADFLLGYGVFVPHDDYDLDRLRELVEADREGRLFLIDTNEIVLPDPAFPAMHADPVGPEGQFGVLIDQATPNKWKWLMSRFLKGERDGH